MCNLIYIYIYIYIHTYLGDVLAALSTLGRALLIVLAIAELFEFKGSPEELFFQASRVVPGTLSFGGPTAAVVLLTSQRLFDQLSSN